MNEVLRRRVVSTGRHRIALIAGCLVVLVLLVMARHILRDWSHGQPPDAASLRAELPELSITLGVAGLVAAILAIAWLGRRAQLAEQADDHTVALLGDATPLVRGLNEMDFEEIHLAGKVLPARPDLHRRAERLVRLHGLCEAQPPA
jgi:hypothetical protein